jgi:hypothetical protein
MGQYELVSFLHCTWNVTILTLSRIWKVRIILQPLRQIMQQDIKKEF